jgi:hypothetical protein
VQHDRYNNSAKPVPNPRAFSFCFGLMDQGEDLSVIGTWGERKKVGREQAAAESERRDSTFNRRIRNVKAIRGRD